MSFRAILRSSIARLGRYVPSDAGERLRDVRTFGSEFAGAKVDGVGCNCHTHPSQLFFYVVRYHMSIDTTEEYQISSP